LREGFPGLSLNKLFIVNYHFLPVSRLKLVVKYQILFVFLHIQYSFEFIMIDTQHNITKHIQQTPVAVICEPPVTCILSQPFHRFVV